MPTIAWCAATTWSSRKAPTKPTLPYHENTPTSVWTRATTACATTAANLAPGYSETAGPSKYLWETGGAKNCARATRSIWAAPACASNGSLQIRAASPALLEESFHRFAHPLVTEHDGSPGGAGDHGVKERQQAAICIENREFHGQGIRDSHLNSTGHVFHQPLPMGGIERRGFQQQAARDTALGGLL